jgi:hypothetical protein
MNWGDRIALASILFGVATSIGYVSVGDWRRGLYFILGSAITGVATWLL